MHQFWIVTAIYYVMNDLKCSPSLQMSRRNVFYLKMGKRKCSTDFLCQWAAVMNGHQCASGVQHKPTSINPWNSRNLLSRIENGMTVYVEWHNDYRKCSRCADHNLSIQGLNFKFRKNNKAEIQWNHNTWNA